MTSKDTAVSQPQNDHHINACKRTAWRSGLITTSFALLIYAVTVAPDLTWANFGEDSGELITTAVTLGVPHPSGYPTYVLLGKLFSFLPFGSFAYRLNLFSAVCIALSAGLVTAVNYQLLFTYFPPQADKIQARLLKPYEAVAIAAGLTFAFAPLVWGQALISEVYGLNLLCLALFLWALLTKRPSWLIGLLLGLCLTTHLTSALMLPLAFMLIGRQQIFKFLGGLFLGLTPFLLPPLFAQGSSPIIWSQPDIFAGWWWLVSGQIYRPNLFNLSTAELLLRMQSWMFILLRQFLWVGFLILFIGLFQAVRTAVDNQFIKLCLLILGTAVLYLIYALGYGTPDAIIFTLPALLLFAILLGSALKGLGWFALSLPLVMLLLNFQLQDLSNDRMLRPLAEELLNQMPADTVVLTEDAPTTFALWYFHFAEKQRPDLTIVDTNLFAFDWYRDQLRDQQNLIVPEADDLESFYADNELTRPLCRVSISLDNEPATTNSCLED